MNTRERRTRTDDREPRGADDAKERGPERPGAARLVRLAAGAAALAAIWWFELRSPQPTHRTPAGNGMRTLPTAALGESIEVAERTRDWTLAIASATELSRREPRNPQYLLLLASEWSNLAMGGDAFERRRTPLRTSRARVRAFDYTLTLLDSASLLARNRDDLALIHLRLGQLYEMMGLPIDALTLYADGLRRVPGDSLIELRSAWVLDHLQDPLTDDRRRTRFGRDRD